MNKEKEKIGVKIMVFAGLMPLFLMFAEVKLFSSDNPQKEPSKGEEATSTDKAQNISEKIASDNRVILSEEEKQWLADHPVISVVQDLGWPPIEFGEKGEYQGITSDYLKIIEERLGIKFKRIYTKNWQESYDKLKKWEIDMTTCVAMTPDRNVFWEFTNPYMKIPIVILTRADVTYVSGMKALAGKKVAVVDGYAAGEWIPREYPDLELVKVRDVKEGLELLQNGGAFAFIDNMLVSSYYLAKLKMMNIKIAGESGYVNAQSMAVRKDWKPLVGILQKVLDSISETERDEIYRKWVPIRYEHGFDYVMLRKILSIFIVIVLALAFWVHFLSREIRNRKKAESALEESEMKMRLHLENTPIAVIEWNTQFCVTNWNKAAEKIFGYTREEALGKPASFIVPEKIRPLVRSVFDRLIDESGGAQSTNENITKDGKTILCEWINTKLKSSDGRIIGLASLAHDVTNEKIAEEQLKASLAEKETLIRELYHRTKNNMQVIISFLHLEKKYNRDIRISGVLDDVISRIHSMSLVHEKLYHSKNLSRINIREYLDDLVKSSINFYNDSNDVISVEMDIEYIEMIIDAAVPLGLVVNEIVSNSVKYAFKEESLKIIKINLRRETQNTFSLTISDNGMGLPLGFDLAKSETLGIQTVIQLVEKQMGGSIQYENNNGLTYRIQFKDDIYKERV